MDAQPFIGLLTVLFATASAVLALKLKQLSPQLRLAENSIKLFVEESGLILGLLSNLGSLLNSLELAASDGDISNEEAQKLIADGKEILSNPVFTDLKNLIEENY